MPGRLVYIVDDDPLLLEALSGFLGLAGWETQCFRSADAFRSRSSELQPGVLLLDVRMEGTGGIQLLERWPSVVERHATIVVTGYGDVTLAVKALRSGAINFLEKPVPPDQLREALDEASEYLQAKRADELNPEESNADLSRLTPREKEILSGLAKGRANKVIAGDLGISVRTVEMHRANLMQKLKVKNAAELLAIALTAGRL